MCPDVPRRASGPQTASGLRELLGDASLVEDLQHFVGVVAELLPHRIPDHVDEAVASGVALLDQALDKPADLAQRIVDIGRVLAAELHDLDRFLNEANLIHPDLRTILVPQPPQHPTSPPPPKLSRTPTCRADANSVDTPLAAS